ncbi:MAG: response regulator [Boseongicola sp.]|nr:response regulator [Boseongicola sp.]
MGGEVWLDSREGVGSGFGFRLPLTATVDVEADDLTAPPWLERAFIVEQSGMNRTVLAKQLGLIGLSPVLVDSFDDLASECPGPKDLIVVGQSSGGEDPFVIAAALKVQFKPAGLFKIVVGPTKVPEDMAFDRLLPRPVLRAAMMESLTDLRPPVEITDAGEDDDKDAPLRRPAAPIEQSEDIAPDEEPTEVPVPPPALVPLVSDVSDGDAEAPVEAGPRRMRVLAAEDNRTNRFVFEKMLKSLDIDLVFAENGLEAIEAFEAQRPDIIFTDISMPKMDGKEATRRIRAIEAERGLEPCPIVAVTAHAMEGDEEGILAAGIDAYLTKPLKKQKLIDHILTAQPLDALPCLPMPSDPAPVIEEAPQTALQGG